MPGRGQYWKKGGLIDETVKEEDLSQALQTKVNAGGGGAWEKVTEVELTVAGTQINMPISPSIVMDTVAEVKVIVKIRLALGGQVRYVINDVITGGQYHMVGLEFTSGELGPDVIDEQGIGTGFSSGIEYSINQGLLTVLYMMNKEPKKFTGGDFMIKWNDIEKSIPFENNTILIFPRDTPHKVKKIKMESDDFYDKRFTIQCFANFSF